MPAKIEDLDIGYIDGMLLLPLVEEHTIDERSPLCGHTHESLMAVSALKLLLLPCVVYLFTLATAWPALTTFTASVHMHVDCSTDTLSFLSLMYNCLTNSLLPLVCQDVMANVTGLF